MSLHECCLHLGGIPGKCLIFWTPDGRMLAPDETLGNALCCTGSANPYRQSMQILQNTRCAACCVQRYLKTRAQQCTRTRGNDVGIGE